MGARTPFRFAVQSPGHASPAGWRQSAQRFEELGFDVLSLPDHLGPQLSPLPALAAAAMVTERIRLSMFVLANDLRNPALLARDIATIDAISGGRIELGLGAGWSAAEYAELGVPFEHPGVRIARLGEAVTIVRQAFAEETFSFRGEHYELTDFTLGIPIVQRPIPLVLGGGGPKMLALAARRADIVSVTTDNRRRTSASQLGKQYEFDTVAAQIELVRAAAGSRFDEIELNVRVLETIVGPDRADVLRGIGERIGADPGRLARSPFVFAGTPDDIVLHILQVRESLGISYFTISERHADLLLPVLERLRVVA
jgi:probable F420-dependent oxidoreductase